MIDRLAQVLPRGMKLIPLSNDGLLENVIKLVGLETLCIMVIEEPGLAQDIFTEVGSRLVSYYRQAAAFKSVGACMVNDDWGFKTSTMFSPQLMRQLVFPWHRRMVEEIHGAGKPAILHSCGHFETIVDEIIDDIRFDGRHSYEDTVMPVEMAYEKYHDRLAILGGIDMNFISRSTPLEVYHRSQGMLERAACRGGYALGTGNSVPEYVPDANYFAMIRAALEVR
jgi:uroporphyrinogen decarboxylase